MSEDKETLIQTLLLITGYSRRYFEKKTPQELTELYNETIEGRETHE